jgi:hypothetical protein
LADARSIFCNLLEIKILDTSFGKKTLTEAQRVYLTFYNQLGDLYTDFTSSLIARKIGYEGMIYKDVANKVLEISPCNFIYIFAGLYALTPSELEILHHFYIHKNTKVYFDVDHFYDHLYEYQHNNKYGGSIDNILHKLRISEIPKSNDYEEIRKEITCIGAPKHTAQIFQAIDILNNIEQKQGNLNDTVLVLADETMLLPFVHAYKPENANITMGYPLKATYPAQQLQQWIDTEKQNNRVQKPIYHLKTQGFEFLQELKSKIHNLENENINSENYYPLSLITNLIDDVSTFLEQFFVNTPTFDFSIANYFLMEKLNAATIPFSGNVYEGLQVMGLLETRMLDFKNVIILSVNEGVIPKGKGTGTNSLLLYEIKRHYGLSTHESKDSIFGYHFFRLLQRAENIFLIYDNDSTDAVEEKSRFVEQLEFEVKKQLLQKTIRITHKNFALPFTTITNKTTISIKKTAQVIEKLIGFNYSPSSLNAYIRCSMSFYWKYIENITLQKTFDINNESMIVGTIIHKVLEDLFKELIEKTEQFPEIFTRFKNNIDNVVFNVFQQQKEIAGENIFEGKLFLAFQVVKTSILSYIEEIHNEWKNNPSQIIDIEKLFKTEVQINGNSFNLFGKPDHIEMKNNKVTILDYKTGKVEQKYLKLKAANPENIFTDPNYSQLFQLLCYAYLYQNDKTHLSVQASEIQCGIIAFQELYKKNDNYIFYVEIEKEPVIKNELLLMFEEYLKHLFSSIIDETHPICQTEDLDNCKYCDYKTICNK